MLSDKRIAFIGSGAMGEAMIKGILNRQLTTPANIIASDPWQDRLEYMQSVYGIPTTPSNVEAVSDSDIVVLSIKPQTLPKAAKDLHSKIGSQALVLSIIAGARINSLQSELYHDRIVRAMPNTPAQVGKGMTVWTATRDVSAEQLEQTSAILGALGEQLRMEEERFLDMATGLSGSGPGFVFLIIEAMIDAGVHMGFSRRDAQSIVLQTIDGSVELVRQNDSHTAQLKNLVTSPGGTTAAGLYELEKAATRAVLSRAIFAAYRRSQELGEISDKKDSQ